MTLSTTGYVAMALSMAHGTPNLPMPGKSLANNIIGPYMTGTTFLRGNTRPIINSQGLMGTVAFATTLGLHGIRMRLMAITTRLYLTMKIMAGCTGKLGMNAGIFLKLLKLTTMTGQTGNGNIMG